MQTSKSQAAESISVDFATFCFARFFLSLEGEDRQLRRIL